MRELWRFPEVPLREIWPDEARDFTPWLGRNLELLGDPIGKNLQLLDKEVRFHGPDRDYQPDLIAEVAETRERVVIENQLERSDNDHFSRLAKYASVASAGTVLWVAPRFRLEHRRAIDSQNQDSRNQVIYRPIRIAIVKVTHWLLGIYCAEAQPNQGMPLPNRVFLYVNTGEWRLNDALVRLLGRNQEVSDELAAIEWEWDRAYLRNLVQPTLSGWIDPTGEMQRLSRIGADKIGSLRGLKPKLDLEFRKIRSSFRQRESEIERKIREWRFRECCCYWCCQICGERGHKCRDCYCEMCVAFNYS